MILGLNFRKWERSIKITHFITTLELELKKHYISRNCHDIQNQKYYIYIYPKRKIKSIMFDCESQTMIFEIMIREVKLLWK